MLPYSSLREPAVWGTEGRRRGESISEPGSPSWARRSSLSLHPNPVAEPQSEKLGQAHLVLTWFFARKGTAKPHFSINTFPALPLSHRYPHFLSSLVAHVDGGPLHGLRTDPETAWCTSQGHTCLIIAAMLNSASGAPDRNLHICSRSHQIQ